MEGRLLKLEASDPQMEACERWSDNVTEQILFGGAKYGGKSYLGCNLIFNDALTYPDTAYFIARQQLNDLRKHTRLSIEEVFRDWGLKMDDYVKYNGMDNYYECIQTRSPVFFLEGKAQPSDPLFERYGSAQFTRGWIEEGGEFADLAIDNLSITVGRKNNAKYGLTGKVLITCNPKKNVLYRKFYRPWTEGKLPPNLAFIRSLATDNVKGDPGYIKKLSEMKDPTMRARLWLGDWEYDDDPASLMGYDAISDLFTNTVDPGEKYIIADVARYGSDRTVISYWEGLAWLDVVIFDTNSIPQAAEAVLSMSKKYQVPRSHIAVDDDGVGGGVADMLPGCVRFQGGAKPIEVKGKEQNYWNLKAQCSYAWADRVNERRAAVLCGDKTLSDGRRVRDYLEEDLAWMKRDKIDQDGKLRILPKEKVKEGLGRSPDFGDVPMMRMVFELRGDNQMNRSIYKRADGFERAARREWIRNLRG